MAYIVMTSKGMAYIDMSYIVMAYIVMACIVMAYINMSYIDIAYAAMAYMDMASVGMAYINMAYIHMAFVVMVSAGMAYVDMTCSYVLGSARGGVVMAGLLLVGRLGRHEVRRCSTAAVRVTAAVRPQPRGGIGRRL